MGPCCHMCSLSRPIKGSTCIWGIFCSADNRSILFSPSCGGSHPSQTDHSQLGPPGTHLLLRMAATRPARLLRPGGQRTTSRTHPVGPHPPPRPDRRHGHPDRYAALLGRRLPLLLLAAWHACMCGLGLSTLQVRLAVLCAGATPLRKTWNAHPTRPSDCVTGSVLQWCLQSSLIQAA